MATNLQFIKSASATSTTSISVTDCFTSEYDVYAITMNNLSGSSGSPSQVSLRFIDNTDSPITTANYDTAVLTMIASSSFTETKNTNQTDSELFGYADYPPESSQSILYVFNPTDTSSYTFFTVQNSSAVSSDMYGHKGIGVLTETTEVTGIQFLAHSNNFDSGTISVYGVK
jgi:hypothetical protein